MFKMLAFVLKNLKICARIYALAYGKNDMILKIPVARHTRKMILRCFGMEPIHATRKNQLGKLLQMCASDKEEVFQSLRTRLRVATDEKVLDMLEELRISDINAVVRFQPDGHHIQIKSSDRLYREIWTVQRLLFLGEYLDAWFKDMFIAHMQACYLTKNEQFAAIQKFRDLYNIDDDDISFDALRVLYHREMARRRSAIPFVKNA
jgi:hypothetical protein